MHQSKDILLPWKTKQKKAKSLVRAMNNVSQNYTAAQLCKMMKKKKNAKMQHTRWFVRTRKRAGMNEYKLKPLQTTLREGFPEISQGTCKAHNSVLENSWLLHIFVPSHEETDFFMLKVLLRCTAWPYFIENSAKRSSKFFLWVLIWSISTKLQIKHFYYCLHHLRGYLKNGCTYLLWNTMPVQRVQRFRLKHKNSYKRMADQFSARGFDWGKYVFVK